MRKTRSLAKIEKIRYEEIKKDGSRSIHMEQKEKKNVSSGTGMLEEYIKLNCTYYLISRICR